MYEPKDVDTFFTLDSRNGSTLDGVQFFSPEFSGTTYDVGSDAIWSLCNAQGIDLCGVDWTTGDFTPTGLFTKARACDSLRAGVGVARRSRRHALALRARPRPTTSPRSPLVRVRV